MYICIDTHKSNHAAVLSCLSLGGGFIAIAKKGRQTVSSSINTVVL